MRDDLPEVGTAEHDAEMAKFHAENEERNRRKREEYEAKLSGKYAGEDEAVAAVLERVKQADAKPKPKPFAGITDPRLVKVIGGIIAENRTDDIAVKATSARYSDTRYAVKSHTKYKDYQPRHPDGSEVQTPSQRDLALFGAYAKFKTDRSILTEHETELVKELFHRHGWSGHIGNTAYENQKLADFHVKALLDDATSGGQEIVPSVFDSNIIQFPLLNGELYPFVDVQDVAKGRLVDGASVGNPTLTWNSADGSTLSLFTTTALVADISTSVFAVACGIEVGRDFLSDTPVNVGQVLSQNIGERLSAELDRCIAVGNGTTEPQGILNASGVSVIPSVSNTAGPIVVDDALALFFGIGKQYRRAQYRPRFGMNDTTYKRFRSLATGVTGDDRLLFGMNVGSYRLFDDPLSDVSISSDMTNLQAFYCALAKYRMYRRLGAGLEVHTQGMTLAKDNTALFMWRARFGGKLMDSSAACIMTSLKA